MARGETQEAEVTEESKRARAAEARAKEARDKELARRKAIKDAQEKAQKRASATPLVYSE